MGFRDESKKYLRDKFLDGLKIHDSDKANLIEFYDEKDLDSINIYDLINNIYK